MDNRDSILLKNTKFSNSVGKESTGIMEPKAVVADQAYINTVVTLMYPVVQVGQSVLRMLQI